MAKQPFNDKILYNAKPAYYKARRLDDGNDLYLRINPQRCQVVAV